MNRIHRKGKELDKRDCRTKEPYHQWMIKRVEEVKLPFSVEVSISPPESEPNHVSKEEVDELRATITRLTKENEEL